MIQFESSTEEVKYTSDGFILSPRWVSICSHNFKIKFTTVALLLCVEGLGFLSTLSLGNTCSLPMQKWDRVLMRYSGRMPIRAVTKVFRILGFCEAKLSGWMVVFPQICCWEPHWAGVFSTAHMERLKIRQLVLRESCQHLTQVWTHVWSPSDSDYSQSCKNPGSKRRDLILLVFKSETIRHDFCSAVLGICPTCSVLLSFHFSIRWNPPNGDKKKKYIKKY